MSSVYVYFILDNAIDSCKDAGWESLLEFLRESILDGSKEVSLAAIASMHAVLISHSVKVTFESM